ncbi:FMN reductase [Nocardia alba]|uniref:FMN reductase n=1 Tax=Nocardia alba TaxID=225051 RepID=A0A4R1G4Z2_9NOCA|nr:FMN reductase [Nocardia alba]TCK00429.1 FMN reductase [Nocardia alba]
MTTRVAVVSAGLSQPSSTRLLADRLAAATARELGGEVELDFVDLRDHARDLADNLLTGFPAPALRAAIEQVVTADGLIAVTPIFSASYSGLFKTFFDVLEPDSLAAMPVLTGATGGTERHSLALEHAVRPLFAYLRSIVVPTAVYAASTDWGANGADKALNHRIDRAAAEFGALLLGRSATRPSDPYTDTTPFEDLLAAQH